MEYYWLSFLLVGILILFIVFTCLVKNEKLVAFILVFLSALILTWKIIEFSYYAIAHTGTYPIEISHISYFVFSVIILSGIKRLYFTAGVFGLVSGLGYMVGGIVSPKTIMTTLEPHIFIMGIVSHMILLLGGMLTIFKYSKYKLRYFYFPIVGLCLALIFAYFVNEGYIYPEATGLNNLVIIKLVNGSILTYLGVNTDNQLINRTVTILIYILVFFIIFLLNVWNNRVFKTKLDSKINIGFKSWLSAIFVYK